jgi:hypothetical protein
MSFYFSIPVIQEVCFVFRPTLTVSSIIEALNIHDCSAIKPIIFQFFCKLFSRFFTKLILDKDLTLFHEQVNTSQNINLSYGYITWLNGKASSIVPQTQFVFQHSIILNGPAEIFCALGKDDQKIYVVPSQNLVIIRMGNTAGGVKPGRFRL